ncbi:MAG TPA: thioesterase II family protein [Pyrinomonadaceae bacterium]|nr:thioesterase II family protein [Pyrinomonadaceae bacterium]
MNTQSAVKSCVMYPKPNPQSRMRLFCFPYAGGTAAVFRNWPRYLPSEIEVCAIQYAGRGSRLAEPLSEDVVDIMNGVYADLQQFLTKPFAFFGHSMGALVSYEFARRLQREKQPEPFQLFVSGCTAPHVRSIDEPTYNLPEPEFIAELRRLQGTPGEVLDNAELMQLMMPIIRTDFKASQTYQYVPGPPLECPVRAFGGLKDEMVPREKVEAWSEHTNGSFRAQMLPGDHFFLNTSQSLLTRIIAQELLIHLNKVTGRVQHA